MWSAMNQRRIELIGKSRSLGLSADEAKELEQLQDAVDQHLEPMDRQLIAAAEHFRFRAAGLVDEPNHRSAEKS